MLVDGAHNPASSRTLRTYINSLLSALSLRRKRVHIAYILALSHSPLKKPKDTLEPLLAPVLVQLRMWCLIPPPLHLQYLLCTLSAVLRIALDHSLDVFLGSHIDALVAIDLLREPTQRSPAEEVRLGALGAEDPR